MKLSQLNNANLRAAGAVQEQELWGWHWAAKQGTQVRESSQRDTSAGAFPAQVWFIKLCYNTNYCWNHVVCCSWEGAEYFSSINPFVSSSTAPLRPYRTSLGFTWPLLLFSYPAFSAWLLPSVAEQKERKMTLLLLLDNDQSIVWRPLLYSKENND